MSQKRFYTLLLVPDDASTTRSWQLPRWLFRGLSLLLAVLFALGALMAADYWYVLRRIDENRELELENRKLKTQIQVFQSRIQSVESTLDRVRSFATRLRVITNIEDRGNFLDELNQNLPDASTNTRTKSLPIPATEKKTPSESSSMIQKSGESELKSFADSVRDSLNQGILLASAPEIEEQIVGRELRMIDQHLDQTQSQALALEQLLYDQYLFLNDQSAFLAALPTRKPAVGYFTSGFGVRRSPYGGKVKMHEGLDIANYPGTVIRAPASGEVIHADVKSGYGNTVILDHGYGLETWYAHCRKLAVRKGQKIKRGDVLGFIGNTGFSTGPHLHYEVRVNGTPVDPLTYILEE